MTMRASLLSATCAALMLTLAGTAAHAIEPIPGSITYNGQPRSKLMKAPIGSIVPHQFTDGVGNKVYETYVIDEDRSLRLVSRRVLNEFFPN